MSTTKFNRTAVIKGKDVPKQVFYCVVLEPGTVDLQGDRVSAEEIEKAAHNYQINYRFVSDSHRKDANGNLIPQQCAVAETYIAPVDFEIEGEKILKGSWVMAIKVFDAETWHDVEVGEIDGLSIGGDAYRIPDGEQPS